MRQLWLACESCTSYAMHRYIAAADGWEERHIHDRTILQHVLALCSVSGQRWQCCGLCSEAFYHPGNLSNHNYAYMPIHSPVDRMQCDQLSRNAASKLPSTLGLQERSAQGSDGRVPQHIHHRFIFHSCQAAAWRLAPELSRAVVHRNWWHRALEPLASC